MASPADIKEIFLAASDRPPSERGAFLDNVCAGNAVLRQRVEALLKAHDATGGWLGDRGTPTSDYPGFTAPSLAELAPQFPQLEILELLGQGGMGAVYKARQKNLDRLVALKILPHDAGDRGFAERFTREARTLAKLNHPGIVAVHDFGTAGSLYWFVMEFVDGVNLRQAKRAATLTPATALTIVPQICEALQFAHDAGIVHRDIKPENVLIDVKGRVKIADFGLAKLIDRDRSHLTGTHQAMGTPHYMAPEQWERPLEVDHRADIYSLGVVFYELLTGELPLGRFPLPSQRVQVDVRLDEVVLKTLEKEPERRYQQVSEVKTEVERIGLAGKTPEPASAPDRPLPPRQISLWWTVIAPTLLLTMLAFGAAMYILVGQSHRQGSSPETDEKAAIVAVNVALVVFVTLLTVWFIRRRSIVVSRPRNDLASPASLAKPSFFWRVAVPSAFLSVPLICVILVGLQLPANTQLTMLAPSATVGLFLLGSVTLWLRWRFLSGKRAIRRIVADSLSRTHLMSPTLWGGIICAFGIANALLPWAIMDSIVPPRAQDVWLRGFNTRFGGAPLAINVGFIGLLLLLLVTAGHECLRPWRGGATMLVGAIAFTLAIIFINDLVDRSAQTARDYILYQSGVGQFLPRIRISVGPYVAASLTSFLLLIGALDLRYSLVRQRKSRQMQH